MRYMELIENIKTIRDFKKESVSRDTIEQIIETGYNSSGLLGSDNISIRFIDNMESLFTGLKNSAGYFGKIIEAPHYLVITSKMFKGLMENSGYIMESMRLKAWELGVGSCWLSIEDSEELKKVLKIDTDNVITAFIALGYQYKGIFKTDTSQKSSRLGIEDIVYKHKWGEKISFEEIDSRGLSNVFYYSKLAPSWGNIQPWRFILCDDKVALTVSQSNESNGLDSGIIMLYFEKAAHEEGITGNWSLYDCCSDEYDLPENYKAVAYYSI
ncbi:nitroreductase family protein [Brassicibacter mesophilus]|uniref:nitroreductase family protein n=1 Tax=Brassicibacter mesophilus TaxID=745119 RepID=UPI003D1CE485